VQRRRRRRQRRRARQQAPRRRQRHAQQALRRRGEPREGRERAILVSFSSAWTQSEGLTPVAHSLQLLR
jgi:hypothetical protein